MLIVWIQGWIEFFLYLRILLYSLMPPNSIGPPVTVAYFAPVRCDDNFEIIRHIAHLKSFYTTIWHHAASNWSTWIWHRCSQSFQLYNIQKSLAHAVTLSKYPIDERSSLFFKRNFILFINKMGWKRMISIAIPLDLIMRASTYWRIFDVRW